MCGDSDDLITTERVGVIVWTLLHWEETHAAPPTSEDLAGLVGITRDSMARLLNKLSRVLPIYRADGGWRATSGPARPNLPNRQAQRDKV